MAKKHSAKLRARVKWMTHQERMNLLQGLAGLVYEADPGTPKEKRERFIEALLKRGREK